MRLLIVYTDVMGRRNYHTVTPVFGFVMEDLCEHINDITEGLALICVDKHGYVVARYDVDIRGINIKQLIYMKGFIDWCRRKWK